MKNNKQNISDRILTIVIVTVMITGMFSIAVRIGTRFLIKRGICNERFAKVIFFDDKELAKVKNNKKLAGAKDKKTNPSQTSIEKIDWKTLYPFNKSAEEYYTEGNTYIQKKEIILEIPKIKNIFYKIDIWGNEHFAARNYFISSFMKIESILGMDSLAGLTFYINGTYKLENGHLTNFKRTMDSSKKATSLIKLNNFLKTLDTPFLYVQAPFKIDPSDKALSGRQDFSNQNTDKFLAYIQDSGVGFIDMRDEIKKAGLNHYDCFYKTDHHWKSETGLWATKIIAETLNENFSLGIDEEIFAFENYNFEILKDSFLGSHGRAVTLANADMEDITLITPKNEYSLEAEFYSEANVLRKATGGFDVLLFPELIQTKETAYKKVTYAIYMSGDTSGRIKNNSAKNNLRILFLGDSFTDVVEPFFALGVKEFDTLDLRHFTGSLTSWLQKNGKYDTVIMLVNAGSPAGTIDYTTHTDLWDFR